MKYTHERILLILVKPESFKKQKEKKIELPSTVTG